MKINHPQFDQVLEYGHARKELCVAFVVGYYADPPQDVIDAQNRIQAILATIEPADREALRPWHGELAFNQVGRVLVNPEITEKMIDGFVKATLTAYPDWKIVGEWLNQVNGKNGYSIRIVK